MYLDTCYITKFYLNEPESGRVRELVRTAGAVVTSAWAVAEFHGVIHRRVREGGLTGADARELSLRFGEHGAAGLWNFLPVGEGLLRRTGTLLVAAPAGLFLRAADAVHLATAQEAGEREVWTNDRHMLAAAEYFGLRGRWV